MRLEGFAATLVSGLFGFTSIVFGFSKLSGVPILRNCKVGARR